ncbi:hypothetical protein [Lacisediminihabitans sp.]|jgi:hypothetical protein|uniref:hypothetical protein n=1 Tax=Lacisediminihabitans sp. TaxID=2787631 RepID=UPI002F93C151
MDYSQFQGLGIAAIIIGIVVYALVIALGIFISYLVIRAGVRRGMRDHYEWVQRQNRPL